jgi:hypothetical protein
MENFVNLTPHTITLCSDGGQPLLSIEPSGDVARVTAARTVIGAVEGGTVSRVEFGPVEGLPDPQEGTIFIVSLLVLNRCAGRDDVFSPGELLRDEAGRPIGCIGLTAAPR